MPNNAKSIVVYVKAQSALGTAATITPASDTALRVYQRPVPAIVGEGLIERGDVVSPVGPGLRPVAGSKAWEITLMTELLSPSAQNDVATSPLQPLWNSCGVMTDNPIVWQPSRVAARGTTLATLVPFTLEVHEIGGNVYKLYDCHAIPTVTVESGQRGMISWAVRGRYIAPATSTLALADVDYGTDPLPIVGINVSVDNDASNLVAISRIELVTGLAFVDRPDVTDLHGNAAVFLDWAEAPSVSMSADSQSESAQAIWAAVFGATEQALTFSLASAGRCETILSIPVGYYRVPGIAGDTFGTYDLVAFGTPDSSGNSLVITWQE
jgi:hypothetical protein